MASVVPPVPRPAADAEPLFQEATATFLESLSEEERLQFLSCHSPQALVADIAALYPNLDPKSLPGRMSKTAETISSFSEKLRPYFEIMGIFVQSHPEWAALAWGAIRLILKLANNYVSFTERLGELLDDIKAQLPRFSDLFELWKNDKAHPASQRLQVSLKAFYVDLFQLFRAIAGVFTRRNKKISAVRQVMKLCWQPFDAQFGNIIARLNIHSEAVRDEIQVLETAVLVQTCQLELQQLSISKQNTSTLDEINKRQQELQHKLSDAIEKQKYARAAVEEKLGQTMNRHLDEVRAMKELLSIQGFATCDRLRLFLAAPEFQDPYNQAQESREEGTGMWLVKHKSVTQWVKSTDNVLWVTGNPGSGKTNLAGTAVSELHTVIPSQDAQIVYFFFASTHSEVIPGSRSRASSAYRAMLAQILHFSRRKSTLASEPLMNAFTYAKHRSPQGTASKADIINLLHIGIRLLPDLYIVVDGVDECEDPEAFLLEFLPLLPETRTKVMLFSRPSIDRLQQTVPESCRIAIDSLNRSDIRLYCEAGLSTLIESHMLPQDKYSLEDMADWMTAGADGMFLWPVLMFIFLKSPRLAPTPGRAAAARLKAIKDFRYPDRLDNMYARILGLIWSANAYERDLARQVFQWIILQKSPIAAHQLHDILEFSYDRDQEGQLVAPGTSQHGTYNPENSDAMRSVIIMACSSLVVLEDQSARWSTGVKRYSFIHLTALEFFSQRLREMRPTSECGKEPISFFSICAPESEARLTKDCLDYLTLRLPPRPLSGSILEGAERNLLRRTYPFLEYANLHWTSHLQHSFGCRHDARLGSEETLKVSVFDFLSRKGTLMMWLESVYLFGTRICHFDDFKAWVAADVGRGSRGQTHQSTLGTELWSFFDYLYTLEHEWGASLQTAPETIWQDLTTFNPSRFFLQTTATTARPVGSTGFDSDFLSGSCLCEISEDLPDGSLMAVLSIWPSRSFHETWNLVSDCDDITALYRECYGWEARYQLWNPRATEPQLVEEHQFGLDRDEVWLQVQHFLMRSYMHGRGSGGGGHKLHFPIAINRNDLATISILRTVYVFSRKEPGTPGSSSYKSHVLPLDFNETLKSIWTLNLAGGRQSTTIEYTYGIDLNSSGKYALYYETLCSMVILKGAEVHLPRIAPKLAVFSIPASSTRQNGATIPQRPRLLGDLTRDKPSFAGWSFHPTLPVLVVQTFEDQWVGSTLNIRYCLTLWDFSDAENNPRQPSMENLDIPLPTIAKKFNFSDCGGHLVLKQGDDRPKTYSLSESKLLKAASRREQGDLGGETSRQILQSSAPQLGAVTLNTSAARNAGHIIPVQKENGETAFQQIQMHRSGLTEVQLVEHSSDGMEVVQSLVSLPNSLSSYVRASVHAPGPQEEAFTIILNRAANPLSLYSFSEDAAAPVVVKKDPRALVKARKRKILEISADGDGGEGDEEGIGGVEGDSVL
ncbi:hypothetical protein QBC39DRAFT_270676 [Podospora conica]|nr:hypothetical protein QBC39DRAFT_270676 [Schizothecium conicum]